MMCCLKRPARPAGRGIDRDDGATVFLVERTTHAPVEVRAGSVSHGHIYQAELFVGAHRCPRVGCRCRVALIRWRLALSIGPPDIEGPRESAGYDIKRTNHARRLAPILAIIDTGTDNDATADDRGRGCYNVISLPDRAEPGEKRDL